MKTLSVKQVSELLGIGSRAVIKRLDKNQLKGTRRPNKFGVEEWWVYPTAEIKAALEAAGRIDILGPQNSYLDVDVMDGEVVDADLTAPDEDDTESEARNSVPGSWSNEVRGSAQDMADGVWNNIIGRFLGELKERDQLIGEMRGELADKERQLKLLPDFQKEAEIRRQEAEAKELEAIALAKQIQAMQEAEKTKIAEIARLSKVENITVPKLESQLLQERSEKEQKLEEARLKLEAIASDKREIEEAKARLEKSLQQEIERLKSEKEDQAKAIQNQFEALHQKLEKLEKPVTPWWKKMFSTPES
jgi:hypothetical protein